MTIFCWFDNLDFKRRSMLFLLHLSICLTWATFEKCVNQSYGPVFAFNTVVEE